MEAWLAEVAHYTGLVIEAMALVIIAVGSVEAFFGGVRAVVSARVTGEETRAETRAIWLRFARWLVAGLTFQLAADLVHTSVAPTWDDVGRLGAIALIRTFLSYFLDRDIEDMRARQHGRGPEPAGEAKA